MPAFKKVKKKQLQVTKCTPEVIKDICNTLRLGAFIETAVVMAGVSKTTYYNWMKWSRPSDKPELKRHYKPIYAELRVAVERAMEEATVRDLQNIDSCAMGADVVYMRNQEGGLIYSENGRPIVLKPGTAPDWSASAWRLERRSKEWNRTDKKELSGPDGKPIETQEKKVEDPEVVKARVKSRLSMMKEILGE